MFTVAKVTQRQMQLKRFADEIKPEILLLQEVKSLAVVEKIRDVMQLDGYHVACSDFEQTDRVCTQHEVLRLQSFVASECERSRRIGENLMKPRWSVPILACLLSASIHTAKTNG